MVTSLIRIPPVFLPFAPDILGVLGQPKAKLLGSDYYLIKGMDAAALAASPVAPFICWQLPLGHAWPCHPADMDSFIEKAAQAMLAKFGKPLPQAVLVGSLAGGVENSYFKSLASNLRGRMLQIFPKLRVAKPEDQTSDALTLFCMVGRQGLYAGLCTPLDAKGYYPGGTKFMKQSGPDTISRAGAKIAEALHLLKLHNAVPPAGSHWLELGASPGGMTHELLERGYYVTAVDRAPLDERLMKHPNVRFIQHNVADYESHHHEPFDALLCDMNGETNLSFTQVLRLRPTLRNGSLIVFTLKTPASETFAELQQLNQQVTQRAKLHGLEVVSHTHLTYNRREFTVVFRKV